MREAEAAARAHNPGCEGSIPSPATTLKENMMALDPSKIPVPLQAARMIHDERYRQQTQEGYTQDHDDEHTEGQLALLAAAYALSSCKDEFSQTVVRNLTAITNDPTWPFKPKDPIRDLVRAGALLLAELERRLRAEEGK